MLSIAPEMYDEALMSLSKRIKFLRGNFWFFEFLAKISVS
jgi:hypothetical protein